MEKINESKILFQIRYNEKKKQFDFTTNIMDNKEFYSLIIFMRVCIKHFEREIKFNGGEVLDGDN